MMREFESGMPSSVSGGAMTFSEEEIKERMSGNLCRCGAYAGICEAIRETYERKGGSL
jgi:xanthine dehydrogenase YagT iron-sulfur-binding subunit